MNTTIYVYRYSRTSKKRKFDGNDEDPFKFDGTSMVELEPKRSISYLYQKLENMLNIPTEEFFLKTEKGVKITETEEKDIEHFCSTSPKIVNMYISSKPIDRPRNKHLFPEYDKYPIPLMSSNQSTHKVFGMDRWRFAIWYLQPARLMDILFEENRLFVKIEPQICDIVKRTTSLMNDLVEIIHGYFTKVTLFELDECYYTSFVGTLCELNYPSNFCYKLHSDQYQFMVKIACEILDDKIWKRFANLLQKNVLRIDKIELDYIFENLKEENRINCRNLLVQKGIPVPNF